MKLTVRKSEDMGDWYVIERAEHDGKFWLERTSPGVMALRCSSRFSDADVEGTIEEMKAIAKAIREKGSASFKRCSVIIEGDNALFCSPRNSTKDGVCSLEEAEDLASQIESIKETE